MTPDTALGKAGATGTTASARVRASLTRAGATKILGDLLERLVAGRDPVLGAVDALAVFGSYVRGAERLNDVDVLVEADHQRSRDAWRLVTTRERLQLVREAWTRASKAGEIRSLRWRMRGDLPPMSLVREMTGREWGWKLDERLLDACEHALLSGNAEMDALRRWLWYSDERLPTASWHLLYAILQAMRAAAGYHDDGQAGEDVLLNRVLKNRRRLHVQRGWPGRTFAEDENTPWGWSEALAAAHEECVVLYRRGDARGVVRARLRELAARAEQSTEITPREPLPELFGMQKGLGFGQVAEIARRTQEWGLVLHRIELADDPPHDEAVRLNDGSAPRSMRQRMRVRAMAWLESEGFERPWYESATWVREREGSEVFVDLRVGPHGASAALSEAPERPQLLLPDPRAGTAQAAVLIELPSTLHARRQDDETNSGVDHG